MEICYYWIDKFGVIEEQGYNFGSQLIFKYEDNDLIKSKVLSIDENKLYIEGFFNLDNSNRIKNVTAICGENGVGKSTFLRAFKGLLRDNGIRARNTNDEIHYSKRILIIKSEQKYKVIFHKDLFSEENVEFKNEEIKNKYTNNIEFISYGNGENMHIFNRIWRIDGTEILSDISCIYFSHSFDNNFYNDSTAINQGYFDISTKGLLNEIEARQEPFNPFGLGSDRPNHLNFRDDRFSIGLLKEYYISETKKRINLLGDKRSREIINRHNFFPKKVELNIDYVMQRQDLSIVDEIDDSKLLRSEGRKQDLNKLELYIYNYIETMHKTPYTKSFDKSEQIVKQTYLRRIVDSFFNDVDHFLYFKLKDMKGLFEDIDNRELINKDLLQLLDLFSHKVAKSNSNNDSFNLEDFEKLTKSYKNFITFFFDELLDESSVINFRDSAVQIVETSYEGVSGIGMQNVKTVEISLASEMGARALPEGIKLLQKVVKAYESINTTSNFLKIEWEGLSTGEDTLLNIYSRFFNLMALDQKEQKEEGARLIKDNVIILLDEIEHSLHPEWQRTLLNKLIDYLPHVFSNSNSLQLVLATNVPFLIADIPTKNVIYLEKSEEEVQDVETGDTQKEIKVRVSEKPKLSNQTFAANIHSLLMNNFFMKSTLGEFSEKRIKAVIESLKDTPEIEKGKRKQEEKRFLSQEELKATIQTIGEPIIKNKLESMYSKKYILDEKEVEITKLISNFQETEKDIPDKINTLLNEILRKARK
ncbi:AAA family ATPase [Priestia aryabhattai]